MVSMNCWGAGGSVCMHQVTECFCMVTLPGNSTRSDTTVTGGHSGFCVGIQQMCRLQIAVNTCQVVTRDQGSHVQLAHLRPS
jgi:hypothetical protein